MRILRLSAVSSASRKSTVPSTPPWHASSTGVPRKALIAYSLGNFATAMYTLHCRVGLILSLSLVRDESGRVDWHGPEAQLAVNLHRDPRHGGRRLALFEPLLRECGRANDTAVRLRRMAAYLGRHLFGDPEP